MLLVEYSLRLCTLSALPAATEGADDVCVGTRRDDVWRVVDSGTAAARSADAVGQSEVRRSRENPTSSPHQTPTRVGTKATLVMLLCCCAAAEKVERRESSRQSGQSRRDIPPGRKTWETVLENKTVQRERPTHDINCSNHDNDRTGWPTCKA